MNKRRFTYAMIFALLLMLTAFSIGIADQPELINDIFLPLIENGAGGTVPTP